MIAVDTNLLVYSHCVEAPVHSAAKALIASLRSGSEPWAIPWPCVHEFISIVTNPRIFKRHTTMAEAFAVIDAWGAAENMHFLGEGTGHLQTIRDLAVSSKTVGARIHDARIAAICLEHGIRELWTADRDFSLFPKLKTRNPLSPRSVD